MAIWVGAYILLTVGKARWGAWDRVERQVARRAVGAVEVDRRPVIFTSGGLLAATLALMGLVLSWPAPVSGGLVLLSAVLILIGIAYGAISWHDRDRPSNPVSAPGPVESGGA